MNFSSHKDLWVVMVLSLVCLALIWVSSLQIYPLILIPYLLLLILPGYALITAIKPQNSLVTRIVIGFLLGLLLIFILVVIDYLNLSSLNNIIISILFLLAISFSLITIVRRHRTLKDLEDQIPPDESISRIKEIRNRLEEEVDNKIEKELNRKEVEKKSVQPVDKKSTTKFINFFMDFKASFQGKSRTDVVLSVILVIAILLAISTTGYLIVKPNQGEKFTEFYILGADGKAGNYPSNLTSGQQGQVIIGVVNHEFATVNYQLVVMMNNVTLTNETITLQNNEKKEIPFTFTASPPGQDRIDFLLYKSPNSVDVYRSLFLLLNVT